MHVRRRLTEWGNGYGNRITKAEARTLGIRPGDVVDVEVRGEPTPNDVDAWGGALALELREPLITFDEAQAVALRTAQRPE